VTNKHAEKRTKKRKLKKRIVFVISAFVLMVIIGGLIFLHTGAFESFLLQKAAHYFESQFNLALAVESLDLSLFRLSAVLNGVDVQSIPGKDALIQNISARKFLIDLGVATLFGRRIHIQKIHLIGPQLELTQHKVQAKTDKPESAATKKPMSLRIDEFMMEDGSLNIDNKEILANALVADIAINGSYHKNKGLHSGFIKSGRGKIEFKESQILLHELHTEFDFNDESLKINRLSIRTDPMAVSASGEVRDFLQAPRFDFEVKGTLHLEEFKDILPIEQKLTGHLAFSTSLRGSQKDIDLRGNFDVRDASVAGIPVVFSTTSFHSDTKSITVDNFELALPKGRLKGMANIDFLQNRDSSAEIEWTDIDVANFVELEPRLLPYLSSVCSGRLSAKWREPAMDAVQAQGEIRFEPSSQAFSGSAEKYALSGNIDFKASDGLAQLLPSVLRINQISLSLEGTVDNRKHFDSEFEIAANDLSELKSLYIRLSTAEVLPANLMDGPWPESGQFTIKGQARGTTTAPDITLSAEGRDISLGELRLPQMVGRFTFDRTGLGIPKFDLRLSQGLIQVRGRLAYNLGSHTFGDNSVLTITADQVDLEPLTVSSSMKYALKGIFSFKVDLAGSLENPKIEFSAKAENLALDSENISLAEFQGQLVNRLLEIKSLRVRKGEGILEGHLGIDFQSKEFLADLEGRGLDLADFRSLAPQDTPLSGMARFEFKGKGTLEKPVFSFIASLEKIAVAGAYLERIDATAESDGRTVILQTHVPAGRLSLEAKLPLQEEPLTLRGRLTTQAWDAWNTLQHQVEPLPSPVSSDITAAIDFAIPLREWKRSTARMSFEKLAFRYINYTFENQQSFIVDVNAQEIRFEPFQIKGPETELSISGMIPFSVVNPGQISLNGAIDLRILEAFLPNTEIAGSLSLTGDVSGTVGHPVVNARITLQDSLLETSAIPYALHDLTLKAGITNNVLDLEEFAVGVDKGRISAEGKIRLPLSDKKGEPEDDGQLRLAESGITVVLSALDLGRLVDLLPEKPLADVGGELEGTIRIGGNFFSAGGVEIDGEVTKLELLLSKFRMANEKGIRFRFKENIFRLEDFRLSGDSSFIQTGLTLNLGEPSRLDGHLSANLNTSILTPLFEDIVLAGDFSLDLQCHGPVDDIGLKGEGRLLDGLFQLQDIPFQVAEMEGDFQLDYGKPVTFSLSAMFNGGKSTASGKIEFAMNTIKSAELDVGAEQVQVSYPEGFQGLSSGNLKLRKQNQRWYLSGKLGFTQSYFNADIYPGSELVKTLRSQQRALKSDIPSRIRELGLAIDVITINPLIVDNNVASLELDGNIRLGGTVYEPRLSGFVRNREVGEILFSNRSYEVEQVSLDYADADPLEGRVNVIAHTQMQHDVDKLEVTLAVSGPITNLSFSLSSNPPRSQIELASLLITGYGTERLRDEAANVLGDQLMLYFLSPLASPFTRGLKNFLGAEDVRIEPINIATEEDPGARFTFRKGLIHTLDLIYSIDISNTQKQTWVLDYNLTRNFSLQSFAKDDGSYGGSVSHRFFLGKPSRIRLFALRARVNRYKIKNIAFNGNTQFSSETLEKATRNLKKGSVFQYRNLRSALEKLTSFYKAQGYLNAVISSSLDYQSDETVVLSFQVAPKEQAQIVFVGDSVKKSLRNKVISKWNGRLPEEMSMAEAEKAVRLDLNSQGYIEAEVTGSKTEEDRESFYVLYVHFGPKYRIGQFTIGGESAVSAKSIKKTVAGLPRAKGKGLWALLYDFKRSKLRIESLYEEMGFQNAVIDYPEISLDRETKTVDIELPVEQGRQSIVQSVAVAGNKNFSRDELLAVLNLKETDIFSPPNLAADSNMLYSFYRAHGYHDVSIDVQTLFDDNLSQVGIVYDISEGEVHLISEIEIIGNDRTPEHVIRRELLFKERDPLNMEHIIASQKKLYDLLVFRTVNIRPEYYGQQRAKVLVEIQEDPRFGVSYGLRYNSEEKLEVFGQLDLINLFGHGRSGLIFYRQNDRQKDLRFSLKDPYIFGLKLNTLYSISYLEETLGGFRSEEFGFTVQQTQPLPFNSSISYLFRLNRVHTYELDPIGPFPFDFTLFLPEFQAFWVRDTRVNRINAKQGSFLSLSSRYSPAFLKSDLSFISFFGQYSLYLRIHPLLVWASNYRIGIADAFDQVLIPSRRYFAGGANSIRGFERDMVGPYDPYLNMPIGGEATFIVNQELRFPVLKWLEGVAFFDLGNVYRYLDEFDPLDVRTAAGFGLRLNLPAIFLRLDYGINLSPREFEPKTVFYISIGQAF